MSIDKIKALAVGAEAMENALGWRGGIKSNK